MSALKPGFTGNFKGASASMRATSALAWASVTPGLSLAIPSQQKLTRLISARLNRKGATSEIFPPKNSNVRGSTPITV